MGNVWQVDGCSVFGKLMLSGTELVHQVAVALLLCAQKSQELLLSLQLALTFALRLPLQML